MARARSRRPPPRWRATARRRAAGTSPRTGRPRPLFHARDAAALAACSPSSHAPCRRSGTTRGNGTGVTASSSTARPASTRSATNVRRVKKRKWVRSRMPRSAYSKRPARSCRRTHRWATLGTEAMTRPSAARARLSATRAASGSLRCSSTSPYTIASKGPDSACAASSRSATTTLRAPAARPLGLGGIALERGHPPSLPGQELRQEAVGGAHVEESAAASRPEPVEDDRVARVRIALEPIG